LRDEVQAAYRELYPKITAAKPVDENACFRRSRPPNVAFFILESLRHSVLAPDVMSGLDAWSRQGLRCERHYAGTNSSHLGLFALLHGRSPMVYDATLDAQVPPQTAHSLRNSGYETIFITAGDCRGFRRMSEFLNERYFDRVITDRGEVWQDRPERDQRVLAQVRRLAIEPSDKPRFIVVFLMSTHFPYTFPHEFNIHRPSGDHVTYQNWKGMDREVLQNRYRNAARFLEKELLEVIYSLDADRNVILFTGDHGESMGEDGGLAHGSRASEVQTRVPWVMVGPGVPAVRIEQPTTHVDVLPTLLHALAERHVPVAHAHGRDLLSGQPLENTAIITPFRWKQPYDLMLIRGAQRMQFSYRLDSPEIDVYGFCDEAANLDLQAAQDVSPEAASEWSAALRRELERLTR
jgi:membrane-anchored protein YejM (alkaline phosphatase superfamily)